MAALGSRFHTAKEGVNAELATFAGDLVDILENAQSIEMYQQEKLEDLLIMARDCAYMDPQEFRRQCESIVQELDDRRQELSMGFLKQLHTRMLFILTRCTRLLQFEKENGLDEGELHRLRQRAKFVTRETWASPDCPEKSSTVLKPGLSSILSLPQRPHTQEVDPKSSMPKVEYEATSGGSSLSDTAEQLPHFMESTSRQGEANCKSSNHSLVADRPTSLRKISTTSKVKDVEQTVMSPVQGEVGLRTKLQKSENLHGESDSVCERGRSLKERGSGMCSKRSQRVSWGYWGDQPEVLDDNLNVICRICENEVATSRLEDHSRLCALADRFDLQASDEFFLILMNLL